MLPDVAPCGVELLCLFPVLKGADGAAGRFLGECPLRNRRDEILFCNLILSRALVVLKQVQLCDVVNADNPGIAVSLAHSGYTR